MSTRKQRITVSSEVLKWARYTLFGGKLEEAASKLNITLDELNQWESSDPTITISQLKKISKVYKRHISVLLLTTRPMSNEPPKFRKLPSLETAQFDQKTFLAIRQAQEVQAAMISLLEEKQNLFLKEIHKFTTNYQTLTSKVIELLNIDDEKRFAGKNSREQLTCWKRLLESAGIVVLELSFPVSDARAFTLFNPVAAVIVLNSKDTDNARVFSLFHELAHLALGHSDVDYSFDLGIENGQKIEVFCNAFSGNLLVPSALLKKTIQGIASYDEENVRKIANKFKVSSSVIWRRLRDCSLITETQFNTIRIKLSTFDPFIPYTKKFVANKNTHLYTAIKRKGEFFIGEVFEAFNQRKITYYQMLDYVGVKANTLSKIQRLMFN